jgi:transposase
MSGFIKGLDRQQVMLLPECLDDYVDETNPVRAVDAFVELLDLAALGFKTIRRPRVVPAIIPG